MCVENHISLNFFFSIDFNKKEMNVQMESQDGILGKNFYFPSGTSKLRVLRSGLERSGR